MIGVFRKNNQTESYELNFSKQANPVDINRLVKIGWWWAIATPGEIPAPGYLSSDNNTTHLNADQAKLYSYLAQISHRTWIGEETITDGPVNKNITPPKNNDLSENIIQYKIKFEGDTPIIKKEIIDRKEYIERIKH